jgi:glycolate oxidase FAD binding subunit
MIPAPANIAELSKILADANARKEKVERVNLAALNRVMEHTPEDMTVTVEAGIMLAELQKHVGQHHQWLAIDPPNAESTMISEIINKNASGPRRFGCGTIRDYLIGLTVVLADGTVIHSGGKVVKNVAGYDLMKLFIGGQGTVGVVVEATFKLRPLPESEKFVTITYNSLEEANKAIESILQSEMTPVVLDLYNLAANATAFTVVLGFAGTREEVDWQMAKARELGFAQPATLDYEKEFGGGGPGVRRVSVLPSRVIEAIRNLNGIPFVARAGNGIIYHRGAAPVQSPDPAVKNVMQRLKDAYDPNHIFPELPL